jgi:glycine hydroxymethyltransferase
MIGESLAASDPQTYELDRSEQRRQADTIRLIPSENYVSKAVLEASSSVFTTEPSDENAGQVRGEGRAFTRNFPAPGISA